MLDRGSLLRGIGAVLAISLVSLLFIASYAGALHRPTPHDVPLVATAAVPEALVSRIDASAQFAMKRVADTAAAGRALDRREAYASLDATAQGLRAVTSTAASPAVEQLIVEQAVPQLRRASGTTVEVAATHPLSADDFRGLTGFYLSVGWVIAGYLGATFFGLLFGTHPAVRRVLWRLAALTALGVIVGLGGALIAHGIAGWERGTAQLALWGLLTVLSVGSVTIALQSVLGLLGTGVAILLFVVLGNPSAGGPYPSELLPGLWRVVGPYIPTGASTSAVRDIAYFPDASLWGSALVLLAWLVVGLAASLVLGTRRGGSGTSDEDVALAGVVAV